MLQGAKVKLPRKTREGKVLGRVTNITRKDNSNNKDSGEQNTAARERGAFGEGLVLRAADGAESCGFRALLSTEEGGEEGALGAAAPFAGQVHKKKPCVVRCSTIHASQFSCMVSTSSGCTFCGTTTQQYGRADTSVALARCPCFPLGIIGPSRDAAPTHCCYRRLMWVRCRCAALCVS